MKSIEPLFQTELIDPSYTFENQDLYDGPVVQGWEPNVDRNCSHYIKPPIVTTLTGKRGWILDIFFQKVSIDTLCISI